MRSRLVRVLALLAVCAWGWVAYVLVSPYWSHERASTQVHAADSQLAWEVSDTLLRDPFRIVPTKAAMAVASPRMKTAPVEPVVDSSVPPVLSALLGGDPPMAILDSSGATVYAKIGDVVFGWKVLRVDAAGVVLAKGARRVVLQ